MRRHRVFAYGTLMFSGIATPVTGERIACRRARLDDHARHALRARPYPGAIPRYRHRIDGVLLEGVTASALARIDDFGGDLYRRRRVALVDMDGESRSALVYLLRPRWHPLLLDGDWCPETFRRHWHRRYVERLSDDGGASAHRGRAAVPGRR